MSGTDDELAETVPVPVLEELVDAWNDKVAKHDFSGTPEEYQGYLRGTEEAIESLEQVIEHVGGVDHE